MINYEKKSYRYTELKFHILNNFEDFFKTSLIQNIILSVYCTFFYVWLSINIQIDLEIYVLLFHCF